MDDGAGEADAFFHAATQFGRVAIVDVGQTDKLEGLVDELGDLFSGEAGVLQQVEGDVFFDGEGVEEGGLLEDHADAVLLQVVFDRSGAGDAVQGDFTVVRGGESGDDAQEAGFSGAGGSDEGEGFAGIEREADVLQDGGVVVGFGDVGELEEGGHSGGGDRGGWKRGTGGAPLRGDRVCFILYDFWGFWGWVLMF